MAAGDAAAAVGMDVINPATHDLRDGGMEINKTRDYLANHQTGGTHDASAIASGTLEAARIPNLPASKIASGTLDAARIPNLPVSKVGSGIWTGKVTSSQTIETSGNMIAAATYNNDLAASYRALWVDAGGAYGIVPSSKRFKKLIKDRIVPPALLAVRVVEYRYKKAGKNAPLEVGVIAEELHDLGLGVYVEYDEEGLPFSVNDRRIMFDLLALVQATVGRLAAVEDRLTALEGGER